MNLRDDLANILPHETLKDIPAGFQVIGSVAVVSLPPALHDFSSLVAEAILARHRNVRTVLNRIRARRGELRIAETEILAGEETVTVCREYGFTYRLDVTRSFYTSRLASERRRVWTQVLPGEEVLVPFAGVGPFVIPPARAGAYVTAIEKSPESCRFLRENIRLNRVDSRVAVHECGLEACIPCLDPGFDRAIIPAPYGYDQALQSILPVVRDGGSVHFYTFKLASQLPAICREFGIAGLKVVRVRRCGHVAPGIARYAFDLLKGGV